MGKGKLVAGIILLIVGVGLIPASIGMNRHMSERMDLSVNIGLYETRNEFLSDAELYALQESIPLAMLDIRNRSLPLMPELVNGSVSAQTLASVMNDLAGSIGLENATDWFFNDPSFTTSTSGDYDIQGISEYIGMGNLSYSSEAKISIYNRLKSYSSGAGIYTFFEEIENIAKEIGQFNDGGISNSVTISGDLAFIAEGVNGIEVLNISDLSNIVQIGEYDTTGEANKIVISGDFAFVADGSNGVVVLNITDLGSITQADQFDNGGGEANDLAVLEDFIYVADGSEGLEILNLTNGFNVTGIAKQVDDGGDARALLVSDGFAFVADGSDGFEIINVTDPVTSAEIGQFVDGGVANDVYLFESIAYVADGTDGLEIIDISNISNPVELGQFDDGGSANSFYKYHHYGFVADGTDGLEILDLSNSSKPIQLGNNLFDGGTATGVTRLGGSLVFVADADDGMEVFDITNPSGQADTMEYYNSTWNQIQNVSTYITDYLMPSIPSLLGISFAINSTNAEKLFYMQWANNTFMADTFRISLGGTLNARQWEFDREDLNLSFADIEQIWNVTDSNSPFNETGIRDWIRATYNPAYVTITQDGWNVDETVSAGLLSYLFDPSFIEITIERMFPLVSAQSLSGRTRDLIYLQWANGYMRPEGLAFLDPFYQGFEVTLPPEDIGLNLTQIDGLWFINNSNGIRKDEGLLKWFELARAPEAQRMNIADGYNITEEFDLGSAQINLLCDWLIVFRNTSSYIVQEVQDLPIHPYELTAQLKIGTYIGTGLIGFIGLVVIVKALRKDR